jgi:hypothetical protein
MIGFPDHFKTVNYNNNRVMELVFIGLLGVIFLFVVYYLMQMEGFVSSRAPLASSNNSSLPAPAQESMISHDLPGAVTAAPDQSAASTQDLIALQDAIRFFHDSVQAQRSIDKATMNEKQRQGTAETLGSLAELEKELPAQEARVKAALTDLSKNNYTVEEVTRLRSFYEIGADQILTIAEGFAEGFANPRRYNIAGPYLTAKDLQELLNRIGATRKELVNQRSMSPPVRARIDQLEKLGADIREIREKVVRKQMDPRDIPIDAEAARKFLAGLTSSVIPPLVTPHGVSPLQAAAPAAITAMTGDPMVQQLLDQAKNLRWNMQVTVGYDPLVVQRQALLQRLDTVEKRLQELSTQDDSRKNQREYNTLYKELTSLTTAIGTSFHGSGSAPPAHVRPQPASSTRLPDLSTHPSAPHHTNLACAQSNEFSDPYASVPTPAINRVVGMTDEQIKHRASSGTASYGGVGGADYKTRTTDLCRSIGASGLGDPKDFGCLLNPDEVSPTYSWKGAHKMICNRLGDTWGASYPEQFGCGKYDPTARFNSEIL